MSNQPQFSEECTRIITARPAEELTPQQSRTRLLKLAQEKGWHTRKEWLEKLQKSGYRCYYCHQPIGRGNVTKDHKTPLCRGGSDHITNVVPACRRCNQQKAWRTEAEFRDALLRLSALVTAVVAKTKSKPSPALGYRIRESDLLKTSPYQPQEERDLLTRLIQERRSYSWWRQS